MRKNEERNLYGIKVLPVSEYELLKTALVLLCDVYKAYEKPEGEYQISFFSGDEDDEIAEIFHTLKKEVKNIKDWQNEHLSPFSRENDEIWQILAKIT